MPVWQEALVKAEIGADAEQELRAGVESLMQDLEIANESPVLADAFSELLALSRSNGYMLFEHTDNLENPHNVTCEQLGALTEEHLFAVNERVQSVEEMTCNNAVDIAIHTNTDENPNPHEITCEKIGAATKEELQASVGDVEAALDGILAMQTELIGGDGV